MRVAVIGANCGDEGKGNTVDALVRRFGPKGTIVVRHNGGAQAGHTVVDGARRHVFGHIGAGYFAGAHTHLSRYFISNPLLLAKEAGMVRPLAPRGYLGTMLPISADPRGLVTTHYDMLINQTLAYSRGGSCGVGINETIERTQAGFTLNVADMREPDELEERLKVIEKDWWPSRCQKFGIRPDIPHNAGKAFMNAAMHYTQAVDCYLKDEIAVQMSTHVICEGAQGLLLDQTRGWFPHVTRSNTGIMNARAICGHIDHAYYVTRWYMTRHGDGPLPDEMPGPPHAKIVDQTNVDNPYQGKLRFARLNVETLRDRIWLDVENASGSIVVTCLDQNDGTVEWRGMYNEIKSGSTEDIVKAIGTKDLPVTITAYGPSAIDVIVR